MPTFQIDVEFEVFCDSCGAGLCRQTRENNSGGRGLSISVEPCERCLTKANDSGYEKGYEQGVNDTKQ